MLLLAVPFSYLHAQKEDNVWVLGYNYDPIDALAEGVCFYFGDSLEISYAKRPMAFFDSGASICDSLGNLLLYSNGCYVETAGGGEVEGSEGMNPGIMYDLFCADNKGYNSAQNMMLLPDPGNPAYFHFFHCPVIKVDNSILRVNVLHTVVDLSANNGNGTTIFKNQVVVADTLHYDGLHAVRHANGRDWWIVAAKQSSNKYFFLLLTPEGVALKEQSIGEPAMSGDRGETAFSPDGTKMARYNAKDDLRIFDFDRCSGELSNPIFIEIQDDVVGELFAGLAWSADSRYLYISDVKQLFQFDATADNIAATKVKIAQADPPICPLSNA